MTIKYMISDTDLEKIVLRKPEKEPVRSSRKDKQPSKESGQLKMNKSFSNKSRKLKALFMVMLIVGIVFCYCWTVEQTPLSLESSPADIEELVVTSVVYSDQNPSAVISDRILHEGDMIDGYKIVKILSNNVEFEKDGRSYTKQVSSRRSPLTQMLINMRNSIKSGLSRLKRQVEN